MLWLPLLFGLVILLHIAMVIRQGIAPRTIALETGAPTRTSDDEYPSYYKKAYAATKRGGMRFWPDIVGKDIIASFVVVLALLILALAFGAPLDAPADPTDTSYVPRPEWYFLPFFQLLKLFPGSLESTIAIGVPLLLVIALLGLPFFDRGSRRNLRHRPIAMASLVFLLGGSALLLGAAVRDVQPVIAPESGVSLNAAERAGRALFQRQCAGCHVVGGQKGGDKGPELTDIGSRHSASWLHSFVENPILFHPESEMSAFGPPILTHQDIEELARYLTTLRGPRGHPLPVEVQDTFPDLPQPAESPAETTKAETAGIKTASPSPKRIK